jgi:hypothetical protein
MRVFVNATAVDIDAGATAFDCVRRWQPAEADAIAAGQRVITDSRGLPIDQHTIAHAGSIYRTIPNRAAARDE